LPFPHHDPWAETVGVKRRYAADVTRTEFCRESMANDCSVGVTGATRIRMIVKALQRMIEVIWKEVKGLAGSQVRTAAQEGSMWG